MDNPERAPLLRPAFPGFPFLNITQTKPPNRETMCFSPIPLVQGTETALSSFLLPIPGRLFSLTLVASVSNGTSSMRLLCSLVTPPSRTSFLTKEGSSFAEAVLLGTEYPEGY